jgi:hypothetical protein
MSEYILEHSDGPQETTVSTIAELDALLDQITAEAVRTGRPELPTLYDNNGRSLAIGVGDDRLSVLSWTDDNAEGDAALSQGDETVTGEVKFFYGNQFSFFPSTALIPIEQARHAMRQFMTAGGRPTVVRWQAL